MAKAAIQFAPTNHVGRVAFRKLVRLYVPTYTSPRKHVRQVVDNGGNLMTQLTCAHAADKRAVATR